MNSFDTDALLNDEFSQALSDDASLKVEEKDKVLTIEALDDIRSLVEAGMQEEAINQLTALASEFTKDKTPELDNHAIYAQVGNLTRDLHTALLQFADDERLRIICKVEMPTASERLSSIITMTDSAATRTIDAVDASENLVHGLSEIVDSLLPNWEKLMRGRIDRYEFVTLCHKVDNLVHQTERYSKKINEQLNNILMAQDYQDLTGQMIQKVIKLVSEVEDKLLNFLTTFGSNADEIALLDNEVNETLNGLAPQGPATDSAKASKSVASSQDEVDDLLASLGF